MKTAETITELINLIVENEDKNAEVQIYVSEDGYRYGTGKTCCNPDEIALYRECLLPRVELFYDPQTVRYVKGEIANHEKIREARASKIAKEVAEELRDYLEELDENIRGFACGNRMTLVFDTDDMSWSLARDGEIYRNETDIDIELDYAIECANDSYERFDDALEYSIAQEIESVLPRF